MQQALLNLREATRTRDALLGRLLCPACSGMLAPQPAGDGGALCMGCDRAWPLRAGVLDLCRPELPPKPRARSYPQGGKDLDFFSFFEATLKMRAYTQTTLEDEVYELLQWVDPTPEEPLLVLGGGRGEWAMFLCAAVADVPFLVCDDDLGELQAAARMLGRSEGGPVLLVRCDLDAPPIRPGAFSGAFSFGVLSSVPDAAAHLGRLGRVLHPGGRLAGLSLARSAIAHIATAQDQLAQKLGLRFVSMEELAQRAVRAGWREFRHEQPSNWMARFRLRRLD